MYKHFLNIAFAATVGLTANGQNDLLRFALPEKMPATVNSAAEESLPIISTDGSTLYFTRTGHPDNEGGKTGGQDIWQSKAAATGWQKAVKPAGLNNAGNNSLIGVARGGSRVYLLNQTLSKKKNNPGLSFCDWDDAKKIWGAQQIVAVTGLEVTGHYYGAWVGADERFIFWSLPGVEAGATNDLYISTSNDTGTTWTSPRWLGNMVNTGMNEISPYYDQTLKVLFFASDGHPGRHSRL